MRFRRMLVVAVAGALLTLSGCVGVGEVADEKEAAPLPPVEIPTLTPEPQPFRTQTSFAGGVLSIDVPTPGGQTRTLDTVRDVDLTWGFFLPRPVQPNHSSREWILVDNHYDGRVLLYALASWNADDPADYLAAGWWLVYPPDVPFEAYESATRGVFVDGPELDPAHPPDLPLAGTATYVGGMGGLYMYNYGRAWDELAGSTEVTEFAGQVSLTADFDQDRLTGCLGCLEPIETAHRSPSLSGRTVAGTRSHGVARRLRCALRSLVWRKRGLRGSHGHRRPSGPHHRAQRRDVAGAVLKRSGCGRQSPACGRLDRRAVR